ncbi:MAG: hypothetical protein M1818_007158 [Claussenomyces sp. TS43310]|nr:MAG: hypothetical protein M1818_007158 [Claussenomyces sp. TS43310]
MGAGLSNDARGWIMSGISGIACVLGACFIGVDLLIRKIPNSKCKDFRIQNSEAFLAGCFSLSFGVMVRICDDSDLDAPPVLIRNKIFSALIDMFPSAINYLKQAHWSGRLSMGVALGCAAGGFLAIQVFQRVAHHYIPSHVVDCDHSHDESPPHDHFRSRLTSCGTKSQVMQNRTAGESMPLLNGENGENGDAGKCTKSCRITDGRESEAPQSRRPSMMSTGRSRVLSFVKDSKSNCDENGPCFGYSDPCGKECFKHIRPGAGNPHRHLSLLRSATGKLSDRHNAAVSAVPEEGEDLPGDGSLGVGGSVQSSRTRSHGDGRVFDSDEEEDIEAQHHHHVPENAFLNLGLQTSLAIGLHKLPEGFIAYATNHANPSLGVAVFSALLVHNVTEGFALALPLYLATKSRPRAMLWSCLAGGISQPAGAAIAWLWFAIAGSGERSPGYVAYGVMFAATAGIMTSVALMLFIEGLAMNHDKNLCTFAALFGMGIMGVSGILKE